RMPRDYDTVPLVLFWILTAVWLIPWTSFLPQALASIPHRWGEIRSRLTQRQRACLLFGIWGLLIVAFFSFSTRQEYYTIPALPAFALLVGGWLGRKGAEMLDNRIRMSGGFFSVFLFAVGFLVFPAGVFFLMVS